MTRPDANPSDLPPGAGAPRGRATPRLVRRALHRTLDRVAYVEPVRPDAAQGLVARVYAQVEHDFGMLAPPVALHSPAPEVLAASWLMLRETLVAGPASGRPDAETVAASVSRANACPYCVAVHDATLHGLVPARAAGEDDRGTLAAWAAGTGRCGPGEPAAAPFDATRAPRLVGVAVTFHYLNRMVNVFLDDSPVPPRVPAQVRAPMLRVLGRLLRSAARRGAEPGAALGLLSEASPPGDLAWAAADPVIEDAFARAVEAIERAGRRALPAPVRALVLERLADRDGTHPAAGRGWLDEAVAALPDAERPAARLALLTALASHRVGPADVAAFRHADPDDAALLGLTAWASLAAARRIGETAVYLSAPTERKY
ncbi:carboxymuconolactone decarboxylase family protein [Actinoallomurus sp. NPDC050550]|uniref:carboxymuconolactone decarboxylase family protein n=1 Tax=Actinoallomurus sp. NPDC050550 TaxID=3154937 RepID=UPI0033F54252